MTQPRLTAAYLVGALILTGAGFFAFWHFPLFAQTADPTAPVDPSVSDLNAEISERRQKIDELTRQAQAFEDTIRLKEREVFSLTNELSRLDDQIAEADLIIERTGEELATTQLEMTVIEKQLAEKEEEIAGQRDRLSELVRRLYRERQRSLLEVAVVDKSFAQFFSSLEYLTQLQGDVQGGLDTLLALRLDLQISEEELTAKKHELVERKEQYENQQRSLDEQKVYKDVLIDQTQDSQQEFETLLADIRGDADSINAEITTLENRVREQLGEQEPNGDIRLGTGPLAWPVDASRGISAYFRDPTYPFRCTAASQRNCIGEHSAIDIRVSQGTAIRAAADGYVAIARRLDWIRNEAGAIVRPAYNYVTLIHGEGLSTVYGHLSSVKVVEGTYVTKGDIIGLSGAMPGTAGAGLWTTGPHLHFEVRKDGIPVDPLGYLQ